MNTANKKGKNGRKTTPKRVRNERAKAKASEKTIMSYHYVNMMSSGAKKKEKGTLHQENVRKQTHPEELESEDEPNSTVIF